MIFVILVCVAAWERTRGPYRSHALLVALIGFIAAGISVFVSVIPPIVLEFETSPDQEIRVFGGLTTFPFTLQQHRDYSQGLFHYEIVVGWPDGVPIYANTPFDDQGEFIHWTHLWFTIVLGMYVLIGIPLSAPIIFALEKYIHSGKYKSSEWKRGPPKEYLQRLIIPLAIFGLSVVLIFALSKYHFPFIQGLTLAVLGWILCICFSVVPTSINSNEEN
jgi:4-amino-4-deoxy-L-arabinose transferase-like glycosyltransferase